MSIDTASVRAEANSSSHLGWPHYGTVLALCDEVDRLRIHLATAGAMGAELLAERDAAVAEVARLRTENDELQGALTELKPADEVCVEGSWFARDDLPRILGNFMRSSDEHAREAKEAQIRLVRVRDALDGAE